MNLPAYVLITPARNEAEYIGPTIESVVAQTLLPVRWVIVSDGSSDGTDDIVRQHAAQHPWIQFVRMPERRERHFAGKIYAFNAGCARLQDVSYDVIGNLDADITLERDHFEFLLNRFADDAKLGVAGTPYRQKSGTYDFRFSSPEDVVGACQLFRRECFEEIGGYTPVKHGGVDVIPVFMARMKGWKTWTFTDKITLHHRESGTAQHGWLMARFRSGVQDYTLGGHPVWELFRSLYQMTKYPMLIGGLSLLAGYSSAMLRRVERPISPQLVAFRRREQMQRLRRFFFGKKRIPQSDMSRSSTKHLSSDGPFQVRGS